MTTNEFFTGARFNRIVIGLGGALAILVVFQAGLFIGYRKGLQSSNWETDIHRATDDPRSVFAPFIHDTDDASSHGAIGYIVSIHQPSFMIKGASQAERVVVIGPDTQIRNLHDIASTSDLVPGESVVVIGEPGTDSQLHATFIRILPDQAGTPGSPPHAGSSTSSTHYSQPNH
jgi:hypothetical protein